MTRPEPEAPPPGAREGGTPAAPVHRASPAGPGQRPAPPGAGLRRLALTAALLGGFTWLVVTFAGRDPFGRERRLHDSAYDVAAAARELARRDPGFFDGLVPYERAELESARGPLEAASLMAAYPRERVLEQRPPLVWSPVAAAARYVVSLVGEDGQEVWSRTTARTSMPWPEDAEPLPRETTWVWEVRAEGAAAATPPVTAGASFAVASEQEQVRWTRHVERIAKAVDDEGARAVLTAQWALRRGHVLEAWRAIQAHLARHPKDDYGRALAGYLERVHGMHD